MYASMLHHNLINQCSLPRPKAKGRPAKKARSAPPPNFFQLTPVSRLGAPCFFVSVVLAQIHTANGHFVFRPNSFADFASQSRLRALVSCDACPTSNNCSPSHLYYVRFCGDFWVQCRCCPQNHDASGQRRDLRYLQSGLLFLSFFFLGRLMHSVLWARCKTKFQRTCFCKADASASSAAPSSPSAAEA